MARSYRSYDGYRRRYTYNASGHMIRKESKGNANRQTPEELDEELAQSDLPNFPWKVLLCLEFRNENDNLMPSQISNQLQALFPGTISTRFSSSIVSIAPMRNAVEFTEEKVRSLTDLAISLGIRIGIGLAFSDYKGILHFYQQARTATVLSDKLGIHLAVCLYSEYVSHDFLDHLARHSFISYCKHPLLECLQQYDAKKGTSLYQTLKVYTCHNCNIKGTAEKMYIHRPP